MKFTQNVFLITLILTSNILADESLASSFVELEQTVNNDNQISGKMTINGITYNAICDCNPVTPELKPADSGPKCDPSKLRIHNENNGIGASFEDVRNLVGNIEELSYVIVPETSFKCLDGRNSKGVVATPGGDAGEFILALSVYEDLLGGGRVLSQENIDNFLTQYLKTMKPRKFHMCTDDRAIAHLERELAVYLVNIDRGIEYT